MKLFLSGGGGAEDSILLDKKFAETVGKEKPLLYIPIAIDTDKYPYPSCYNWINNALNPLGITNIEMWTEKEVWEKSEEELQKFGGVYIGGGNTPYLLKELKDSGLFIKLEKLIKNDIPIYGGSAGAIIFGKTIIPSLSADANDVELTDFSGMNLVQGYDIWCHYTPEMDNQIIEYKNKYGLNKIAALPENAGLYVADDKIEEIGLGKVKYI